MNISAIKTRRFTGDVNPVHGRREPLSVKRPISDLSLQERQRLQSPPGARPAGLRLSVPNDEGAR